MRIEYAPRAIADTERIFAYYREIADQRVATAFERRLRAVVEKQALAIGRAMHFGGRLLILDEPTSALGVKEAEIVLRLVQFAKSHGVSVILITHNVHHALAVGDRYVVLIHGEVAADFRRGESPAERYLT